MAERQIPGGFFLNETGTFEAQCLGGMFVNETETGIPPDTVALNAPESFKTMVIET